MQSASGRHAHDRRRCVTAAGSAATRAAPRRCTSRSRASASLSTSSASGRAASIAVSPVSWLRLVTITRQLVQPGSNGRTWTASCALSSTTRILLSASKLRYRPNGASCPSGIRSAGTPSASRNTRTTAAGGAGACDGPKPRRSANNCPSGNWPVTWCAQRTASAVFPIPAVPLIVITAAVPPGSHIS
jgi:hypothetical protein